MEGPVLPFRPCLFEEIHISSSMNTTVSHVVVSLVYGLEPLREALVDCQSPVVIRAYDIYGALAQDAHKQYRHSV